MKATTYVALLRGINVGGKNKLPMKDLVALFVAAECGNTRSFIQSGNVIFTAAPSVAKRLPAAIAVQISERFGFKTPLVLRTTEQMGAVLRNNPFLKAGVPEEQLHVMFLADAPKAALIAKLDPNRSPPDEFQVVGQELYLRLPNGAGNSKLTNAYFDSKLATMGTSRNWRTVTKIFELMQT